MSFERQIDDTAQAPSVIFNVRDYRKNNCQILQQKLAARCTRLKLFRM